MSQKTNFNKILLIRLNPFKKMNEPMNHYPTLLLIPLNQAFLEYPTKVKDKAKKIFSEDCEDYLINSSRISFPSKEFTLASTGELMSKCLNIEKEEIAEFEYMFEENQTYSYKIIELPKIYKNLTEFYIQSKEEYEEKYAPLFYPIEKTNFTFINSLETEEIFLEISANSNYQQTQFYFHTDLIEITKPHNLLPI